MPDLFVVSEGVVQKTIVPVAGSAPVYRAPRVTPNGELFALNPLTPHQAAAEEGSYVALVAAGTIDTGITMTSATGTTFSTTAGILCVFNNYPVGGPDVILDYLQIYQITVDTAGTLGRLVHKLSPGNRYSSGGTQMTPTGINPNVTAPDATKVIAFAGAVVFTTEPAGGAAVLLGTNPYINGIGVKGLNIRVKFGAVDGSESLTIPTTTAVDVCLYAPPVIVPPGWSYTMHEFKTARTAAGTGEFYAGAFVR